MDITKIRNDFPILSRQVNGKQLVYLDNGATGQKPNHVIKAIDDYYRMYNANIHRGVHTLSQEGTNAYEEARRKVQNYINAKSEEEIIFTKGTTDGINLIANAYRETLQPGDEILITQMEHHSNIVPWQIACERSGASLRYIPVTENGELDLSNLEVLLNSKTKLVAFVHVSNALGTINPVQKIIVRAKEVGAKSLLDGAQAVPHMRADVQALDCDYYVFSAHKMFGPTGKGVLYGRKELLLELPVYQGGGDMIKTVTMEKTTYNDLPHRFEAGTPNIAGGIGLGAAVAYMEELDFEWVHNHEKALLDKTTEGLKKFEGLRIIGEAEKKASVCSFVVDGVHPYDIGMILDKLGIAVRTGHHCTEPIMDRFGIPGTVRASFAFYNTEEEVDLLLAGLERALGMLR